MNSVSNTPSKIAELPQELWVTVLSFTATRFPNSDLSYFPTSLQFVCKRWHSCLKEAQSQLNETLRKNPPSWLKRFVRVAELANVPRDTLWWQCENAAGRVFARQRGSKAVFTIDDAVWGEEGKQCYQLVRNTDERWLTRMMNRSILDQHETNSLLSTITHLTVHTTIHEIFDTPETKLLNQVQSIDLGFNSTHCTLGQINQCFAIFPNLKHFVCLHNGERSEKAGRDLEALCRKRNAFVKIWMATTKKRALITFGNHDEARCAAQS